jgi:hypothetical protein
MIASARRMEAIARNLVRNILFLLWCPFPGVERDEYARWNVGF